MTGIAAFSDDIAPQFTNRELLLAEAWMASGDSLWALEIDRREDGLLFLCLVPPASAWAALSGDLQQRNPFLVSRTTDGSYVLDDPVGGYAEADQQSFPTLKRALQAVRPLDRQVERGLTAWVVAETTRLRA